MKTWVSILSFCFFFSSRRRHTRCGRDWISDVCSSDLILTIDSLRLNRGTREVLRGVSLRANRGELVALMGLSGGGKTPVLRSVAALEPFDGGAIDVGKSEERRVGKECKSRWWPDHVRK